MFRFLRTCSLFPILILQWSCQEPVTPFKTPIEESWYLRFGITALSLSIIDSELSYDLARSSDN